jgi:glutathione S-transferase
MLHVHELPGAWGLPSASPFCLKLTTWLRMTEIPYRSFPTAAPRGAPKGKAPFIVDGDLVLGDSGMIIDALREKYRITLDDHLDDAQRAIALAFRRLCEENLYFVMLYDRWVRAPGWTELKTAFFGFLPLGLRTVVPPLARSQVKKYLRGQGMGRHHATEIDAIGCADVDALARWLGDQEFFFGAPSTFDAIAYAFIANLQDCPISSATSDRARAHTHLVAFCERMKARYWNDARRQLEAGPEFASSDPRPAAASVA